MSLSPEELQRHTEALWQLCYQYVQTHNLESSTTGILIVSELTTDPSKVPATCIQYAADPKAAAMTLARCAASELQKAGVKLGSGS